MGWLKNRTREEVRQEPSIAGAEAGAGSTSTAPVSRSDPYSFEVAHRRLAWMLRMSVAMNIAELIAVAALANAIAGLVPLKTTDIALVRTDPTDNRLYRIEPITQDVAGFDLLMEANARRYVRLLLEIDSVTQTERLREAFRMTDQAFYERFRTERIDTNEIQDLLDSGLTRSITVESVDRIDAFDGTYKYAVDLVQTDERGGKVIETKKVRAYLNMTTRPHQARDADKFENPLGITVLDLVLKERGNS